MARAKRHYLPGYVWHITHRCHKREFLLKFSRARRRWIEWLFQAKKRYHGLSILNYMVTSNHIHLLVYNNKATNHVPESIRLIAGRVGQEYNTRKKRKGAFWSDRYHATAIEDGDHLLKCLVYIDLNMVRAGVVKHRPEWEFCGYNEIRNPKKRKGIIDFTRLMYLLNFETYDELKNAHFKWVEKAAMEESPAKDAKWTESIAVGSNIFIEQIKTALGFRVKGRKVIGSTDTFQLRETQSMYGNFGDMGVNNTFLWDESPISLTGHFLYQN